MLTREQSKVLGYLRAHSTIRLSTLIQSCMPGSSCEWVNRIIGDLEWLGYVTVFYSHGMPAAIQITERGLHGS